MTQKSPCQKWLVILLLGLALFSLPVFSSNGLSKLSVVFLNAGYGDCILIQTAEGENLLIDAGEEEFGPALLNKLKARGVSEIHAAFITHPHKNHFGGFLTLARDLEIERLFINGDSRAEPPYQELAKILIENKIPIEVLSAGQTLTFSDKAKIQVLHSGDESMSVNDASLVLKLTYGKTVFLFTSDIGPEIQNRLIQQAGNQLQADIIQIPHHGGPVDQNFIEYFSGKIFVISTGPNPHGLPDENDIRDLKGRLLRTDLEGDIKFESDGNVIRFLTF